MKLSTQPYNLFVVGALACLLMSFFAHQHTLDVHLHDTYYVIAASYAYLSLSAIQFVFFILYKAVYRILFSKTLTWIHTIATITIPIGSVFFLSYPAGLRNSGQYHDPNWNTFEAAQNNSTVFTGILAVFILAQLVFLANISIGRSRKNMNHYN